MTRPCENVNFCLFCECAYLDNHDILDCARDSSVVNKTIVQWWEMSLHPRPLICSSPPTGFTQVKNVYLEEVDKEVILIT